MEISGNTIIFRSTPENYIREKDGRKCNTVRQFRNWHEMKVFEEFRAEYDFKTPNKKIRIVLNQGCIDQQQLERTITDICPFEGYWIISWKHEK